ncbi:hypothetical protein V1509DRAFT_638558 [Lipomyces kononenkoae]
MRQFKLEVAALLAAWASAAACLDVPQSSQGTCPNNVNAKQLGNKLSNTAEIYFPGSAGFAAAIARWSALDPPVASIVVVPGTENDVVETVKFANQKCLPFLATNGAHGSITTLGKMTHGVEIYLTQLDCVEIASNGQTAKIGGGILAKNLTDVLWAQGKQAVTGTCECVGYLGPGLGGGHGWLQGHYGLVSDQYVSMNVVLADGTLTTIDENSDLWWAMRGAGHNFGIVTSVTSKIYDLVPNYAIETLIFSGDNVEAVYEIANDNWLTNGTMPVDLNNWSYWYFDPTSDPDKPVIAFYIIQEGVNIVDPVYTEPFYNIGPISSQAQSGTYLDLAAWTGISLADPPCQKTGEANPRFPIYLKSYNATAQRQVYDIFSSLVTNSSGPFGSALFMFEGYSQQGVKAFPDNATAFAYRSDNLLVAPLLTYKLDGPELDAYVAQVGNQIRQILYEGSGDSSLHAYVNYAYGDETPLVWYGSEEWRQDRLQTLKKKYDPNARFSYYAPVA